MTATKTACPTCGATDPKVCRSDCYNDWHRGPVSDEDYRTELRAREELRIAAQKETA